MRLPELQHRPQRAERPSLAAVNPTDLGLGQVAQDARAWAAEVEETRVLEQEVQRVEDEKAIEPIVQELQTGFEARFAERGANWDGIEPGFARRVQGEFETTASAYLAREGLTPGQADALTRRVNGYRQAVGQRSIAYEAQRRGQRAAEVAAAREAVEIGGVLARFATTFGERKAALDAGFTGAEADYAAGVLSAYDAAAAEIIAATPEPLRPAIQSRLASRRLTEQAAAMEVEARGELGYLAGQARQHGQTMVNAILTDPSRFEAAAADIDQILAGLPAPLRAEVGPSLRSDAAEAFVSGLIRGGDHDAALDRLNSGALDNWLNPDAKARLLGQATNASEAMDVDAWTERLRMGALIEDDISSRVATGQGVPGVDVGAVAQTLGAREAAEYQLAIEEAGRQHANIAGFGQMTPAEIREQLEAERPVPGQEGFASAQARWETMSRAAQTELTRREEDPAAWALGHAPALQSAIGEIGRGDEATARRAAGSYAVQTLTLQEAAGIAPAERRILPKSTATNLVAAFEGNADPAEGLRALGAVIGAFEAPEGATGQTRNAAAARQRMVMNELQAAGLDNGDLAAAVDLSGDPVRLGRYVAATRGQALEGMERDDREAIEAAVDRELAPYLRSFEGASISRALTGGRRLMAQRLAAAQVARGASRQDAVREAADVVAGQYAFVGPSGWRMPRAVAERRIPASVSWDAGARYEVLAQRGASRALADLTREDGAGFYAPDTGSDLTEAQRRERYADTVASRGRWFATPDDGGLALMHPGLDGRWTAALDRNGRPIVRSWDQLVDRGRTGAPRPGQTPPPARGREQGGGRRQPRGVRNNNPGNIEFRSDIRWQGQTGSDGRFARFSTPEHGIRAMGRDLRTKASRGLDTVREIISRWAPPGENNTAAYVAAVSRQLGVQPDAELNLDDPRVLAGLMGAMITHENGRNPYSPALLLEGARRALSGR